MQCGGQNIRYALYNANLVHVYVIKIKLFTSLLTNNIASILIALTSKLHLPVKNTAVYHLQVAEEAKIMKSREICLNLKKICDLLD